MRKIFGGVTVHPTHTTEWYFVTVKQANGTYETLHEEKFDRKKVYGKDFVIATAKEQLAALGQSPLTEQEESWYVDADNSELQNEIIAAATKAAE